MKRTLPEKGPATPAIKSTSTRIKIKILDIDAEIERMNQEALLSTRRIMVNIEDASGSGIRTLNALDDQDEKLERIEENLQQIQSHVSVMENQLREMEIFCGLGHLFNKHIRQISSADDDIDRNLTQIEEGLRTLKEVAYDINTQLELQSFKIERVGEMVEKSDLSIGGANKTVMEMLK